MVSVRQQLSDSIKGMLGLSLLPHSPEAVAAIRLAMLKLIDTPDQHKLSPLAIRLHQIHDAQGLWHARVDLYNHLCKHHGEQHAQTSLSELTPLFRGRIPSALLKTTGPARASSLNSRRDKPR